MWPSFKTFGGWHARTRARAHTHTYIHTYINRLCTYLFFRWPCCRWRPYLNGSREQLKGLTPGFATSPDNRQLAAVASLHAVNPTDTDTTSSQRLRSLIAVCHMILLHVTAVCCVMLTVLTDYCILHDVACIWLLYAMWCWLYSLTAVCYMMLPVSEC